MMKENFKMAKKRFYGVAGINGYGVYNDYEKVLEARPYVRGFMVKGFPYYREAKAYAVDTYKQSVYGATDVDGTYEIKRMNRFYYKDPVHRQKRYGVSHRKSDEGSFTEKRICPFSIGIRDSDEYNI